MEASAARRPRELPATREQPRVRPGWPLPPLASRVVLQLPAAAPTAEAAPLSAAAPVLSAAPLCRRRCCERRRRRRLWRDGWCRHDRRRRRHGSRRRRGRRHRSGRRNRWREGTWPRVAGSRRGRDLSGLGTDASGAFQLRHLGREPSERFLLVGRAPLRGASGACASGRAPPTAPAATPATPPERPAESGRTPCIPRESSPGTYRRVTTPFGGQGGPSPVESRDGSQPDDRSDDGRRWRYEKPCRRRNRTGNYTFLPLADLPVKFSTRVIT